MLNMFMKKMKKNKKGFTLIELIVVIAILAILAMIAIPRLSGFQSSAKLKADIADAKTIATSVATLMADQKVVQTVTFDVIEDTAAVAAGDSDIVKAQKYLTQYMQTIPKVKSEGAGTGAFECVVASGDITVRSKATPANIFFPAP